METTIKNITIPETSTHPKKEEHSFNNSPVDSFRFITPSGGTQLAINNFDTIDNLGLLITHYGSELEIKSNIPTIVESLILTSSNKEIAVTLINISLKHIIIDGVKNNNTKLKIDADETYKTKKGARNNPTKTYGKRPTKTKEVKINISNSTINKFPEIYEEFTKKLNITLKDSSINDIESNIVFFELELLNSKLVNKLRFGHITINNNTGGQNNAATPINIENKDILGDNSVNELNISNSDLSNKNIIIGKTGDKKNNIIISGVKANNIKVLAASADLVVTDSVIEFLEYQSVLTMHPKYYDFSYKDLTYNTKKLYIKSRGTIELDIRGYEKVSSIIIDHNCKGVTVTGIDDDLIDKSSIYISIPKIQDEFNLKNESIPSIKNINIPSLRSLPPYFDRKTVCSFFFYLIEILRPHNRWRILGFGSTYPSNNKSQHNTFRQLANKFEKSGDTKNHGLFKALYNLQGRGNVFGFFYSFISNCGTSLYRPIFWILLLNCILLPYFAGFLYNPYSFAEGVKHVLLNAFKPFSDLHNNTSITFYWLFLNIVQLLSNISIASLFLISLRWSFKRD